MSPSASAVAALVVTGVASPCVSVCRMNAATGLCEGCARTLEEIAHWSRYSDQDKRAVWQLIAQRRALG